MASWRCAPTWGCEALLDAAAKAAHQARLPELRAELEEAEGFNDPARATRARHELDFLVAVPGPATGLDHPDRPVLLLHPDPRLPIAWER
jgi:hypothetical protein